MMSLFQMELRGKLIGFFGNVVSTREPSCRIGGILHVFFAKLFGSGVVEETAGFAEMRRDELIAELLVVGHRPGLCSQRRPVPAFAR